MGDEGDYWHDVKPVMQEESKQRRASNRERSASLLDSEGVKYLTKNAGAHLIVEGRDETVDFWPGTGLFITRRTKKRGRGVRNLLKVLHVHS